MAVAARRYARSHQLIKTQSPFLGWALKLIGVGRLVSFGKQPGQYTTPRATKMTSQPTWMSEPLNPASHPVGPATPVGSSRGLLGCISSIVPEKPTPGFMLAQSSFLGIASLILFSFSFVTYNFKSTCSPLEGAKDFPCTLQVLQPGGTPTGATATWQAFGCQSGYPFTIRVNFQGVEGTATCPFSAYAVDLRVCTAFVAAVFCLICVLGFAKKAPLWPTLSMGTSFLFALLFFITMCKDADAAINGKKACHDLPWLTNSADIPALRCAIYQLTGMIMTDLVLSIAFLYCGCTWQQFAINV
jgi:hypothetical protein